MEHKLTQGNASNYEITLTVSQDELAGFKTKALESFQKEVKEPGFRPGHVPLDIVEKKVQPEYLEVAILEEAIHSGTKKMLEENKDIKFIGNIYDLNKTEKDDMVTFTYKLDVYPEVTEKNDDWKKLSLAKIDSEPTQEEIDETLMNLSKQYASYDEADEVTADAVFKVSFVHNDKDGNEVDKGTAFIGKEEFAEFPTTETLFVGKKEGETVEQAYTEENMPPIFFSRANNKAAATTVFTIGDIKTVTYPEFTEENIKKFFGNDEVKTKEQLVEKVKTLISTQKEEGMLMQSVDTMLADAGKSLQVLIPKTLIDEEMKTRMKSLEERLGGADGLKQYFEKLGEEDKNKMLQDIQTAAQSSLEKFFVLRRLTELFELNDIDWQTPMSVEKALYDKLAK